MGYGDNLLKIQAFSRACMSASAAGISPFKHMSRGWKATRLGNSFLEAAPLIENWACRWHGDVRLDPQIQLAVDAFQKTGLSEGTSMGPVGLVDRWFAQGYAVASVAVMANAFASELRKRGQQVSTVGKMQRHEDAHADRGREVRSYLMSVLKHRPACDVMRFELGMSRDSKLNRQEEYDFMLEASARYLRELKEAFGKAIVGDVRKIDRGSTSGYLVHVLLAWDVPSSHELIAIRQAVVDHWNAQSRGIGYLTDCNAVDAFMYRGAGGQLHHYESNESRLSRAVIFLADTDRIIQVGYDGARDGLVLGTVS